jgi:hypothetical protein
MFQSVAIIALLVFLYFVTRPLEVITKNNKETYNKVKVVLWKSIGIVAIIGFLIGTYF